MSQCVPNWDLDDGLPHHPAANPNTTNIHGHMSDYVVSELTWEKGNLVRHGHGLRDGHLRRAGKPLGHKRPSPGGPAWEKQPASGTLEAVVDQATRALVPAAVDALVPSAKVHESEHQAAGGRVVPDSGGRAAAGSICSAGRKRARAGAGEGCTRSATGSAASVGLAFDSREINGDGGEETGFATSTSPLEGSPETENTSCGRALTAVSEGDDSCYSRGLSQRYGSDDEEKTKNEKERSSFSTKRIRAAAVHNQSERKRRDRINQRMRTLQKLVPNSSKTDKASILDEVIDYMKQLQAQLQMMSRMNSMPPMMMAPMAMQQMQMAMMAQMAQMAQMGMAMGMGMPDVGQSGMPWAAFLPPSMSRDVPGRDPAQAPAGGAFLPPDPFAAFMAFQAQQPMTMDAHSRMAALYQQLHQQPPGGSSNEAPQSGGNIGL